jgi:hypothetical protein
MQPEHGVRYELKLASSSEQRVEYRLRIALATRELAGTARIDAQGGGLELELVENAGLPAEIEQTLRALLRSIQRGQQASGAWPRRVTRWRGEPEP